MAKPALLAALPLVLAPWASVGQTTGTPLSFEVASVKPASAPSATKDEYSAGYNAGMRAGLAALGVRVKGQRVNITDNSLRDLIRLAYEVKDYQISGPVWMADEKYEIAATMPAGTTRGQVPEMLRTLLERRFHLKLRRETRKMPVYALVAVKGGAHLVPTAAPGNRTVQPMVSPGRIFAAAASLSVFAEALAKAVGQPVLDMTGIAGQYDFDLTFTPDGNEPAPDAAPALVTTVRDRLGLRLQRRVLPLVLLVVEQADKIPTEN